MWPGMKALRAPVCLSVASLWLACTSPPPEARPPEFGKTAASEMDLDARGLDIVHADEAGKLWVQVPGEARKRELASELNHTGFGLLAAARGLADDGGRPAWEWLATLSRDPEAELAVLSIHDARGRLAYEEVLLEDCSRLAWRDGDAPELLVACPDHVWRYRAGPSTEAALTIAQFAKSGNAVGPLRFGDSESRVHAALQLAGGVCRGGEPCESWSVKLEERAFNLIPQFRQGTLSRVTLIGPRRPRSEWSTKVRADWRALASVIVPETTTEDVLYPSVTAFTDVPGGDVSFAQTHHPQRDGSRATIGLFRNDTGKQRGFGAIAVISPSSAPAAVPAAPAD